MQREGHFVQEKIQPRSEVGVRGHGAGPQCIRHPQDYTSVKRAYSVKALSEIHKDPLLAHEQNLQGMSLPTSVHH